MPLTKFHFELTGRVLRNYNVSSPPDSTSKSLPRNVTVLSTSETGGSCELGKAVNKDHQRTYSPLKTRSGRIDKVIEEEILKPNTGNVRVVGESPISFITPVSFFIQIMQQPQFRYNAELLSKKSSTYLLQNIRTMSNPCQPFCCCGGDNSDGGSGKKALNMDNLNPNIIALEYAVRGPLVIRALEIEKEILKEGLLMLTRPEHIPYHQFVHYQGAQKPFKTVIKANIGDSHAMEQKPITFIRQVVACTLFPSLINSGGFPEDVKARASDILSACGGKSMGAYTASCGIEKIRKNIAAYITKRDGQPSNFENVSLCAGASSGIRSVMQLFSNQTDGKKAGFMIPIPQYPLYSASIAEFGLAPVRYYLNEQRGWALELKELERSYTEGSANCNVRAIVVINPGNPTGQVLSRENIETIIKFAHEKNLFIFADEVYQHNVYAENCKFHSFKKVIFEMGDPYSKLELVSFMSASKCYMGECGIRGGWMELVNIDPGVQANLYKALSARLCPSSVGQVVLDCVVRHPVSGDPSYELWMKERTNTLQSLAQRAKMVYETFNKMEGFTCNVVQGAMYAFPQIKLSAKAIEAAEKKNKKPDVFYAFSLLEETGICIIPGSGFGQQPGTWHFRTTILPQPKLLMVMLETFKKFHSKFTKEYS